MNGGLRKDMEIDTDRIDQRIFKRIEGPKWAGIRKSYPTVNEYLLSVDPNTIARLTTIYVKYELVPQEGSPIYAVVWLKRSSELVVGLSLPSSVKSSLLGPAPVGMIYAGLTKYLTIAQGETPPVELKKWAKFAYTHALSGLSLGR